MRGYPRFNFDAFDAAATKLRAEGWTVISPADIDREQGFDPDKHDETFFDSFADLIRRDVDAVLKTSATVLLPGWERSTGARAELAVAQWAHKEVLLFPSMTPLAQEDVLTEALRLTSGDRQASYGPPDQDFQRTAAMWTALLGTAVTARQVALCMIALKLSRETHQRKRDNWVDIAGYARCGFQCST